MAHSNSLYRVLALTAKAYTETFLKDGDYPDGSLVLTAYIGPHPAAKAYTETILRDGDRPDGSLQQPISGLHPDG